MIIIFLLYINYQLDKYFKNTSENDTSENTSNNKY